MLVLYDPDTLLHDTMEFIGSKLIPALECPERIRSILAALRSEGSNHEVKQISCSGDNDELSALMKIVTVTHSSNYLHHLKTIFKLWLEAGNIAEEGSILPESFPFPSPSASVRSTAPKNIFARSGYYAFDLSTGIMRDSYRSIIASANLAYEGTNLLFSTSPSASERSDTILALTRPPGHHCDGVRAGGYCYINNAAVAVSTFQRILASNDTHDGKIAILDLDFHHGNGTQHLFYSTSSVLYISIHGEDEYPYYTGSVSETGEGEGEGFNINLPLRVGATAQEYLNKLEFGLSKMEEFKPAFVVVSLGFDTFELDPLGNFKLGGQDYEVIGRRVREAVKAIGGEVKSLILLEGGYVVERLGENLLMWLKGWESL
jgi:acetoin utilization deacetylase AcuC-like enzyme